MIAWPSLDRALQAGGVVAVTTAKAADLALTAAVLPILPGAEVNPIARLGGSRCERLATRALGYGLPCLWWLAAAGYNTLQLANAFPRPL